MEQSAHVVVEGLRDFQRMVKVVQPELRREIPQAMKAAAERTVLPTARALTPKRTGRLAASERVAARVNGAAFTSRLPYANVIHWGGTTGRGHSRSRPGATRIAPSLFASRALERRVGAFSDAVMDELDAVFRRNGWHV